MSTAPADIDVVIPLYNGKDLVLDAIRSVLAQTLRPRSLVVVDDGSSDGGAEQVEDFFAANPGPVRTILLRQANAGPNAARNHGLQQGRSSYVAFLDADDVWMPRKLELQAACFQRPGTEEVVLVHCGVHSINDKGERTTGQPTVDPPLRGRVFDRLLVRNTIGGGSSGVMIARAVFDEVGPFDEELRTSEDYDMWLRISRAGAVEYVAEDLVGLREHARNTTKNALHMLRGIVRFTAKWYPFAKDRPEVLAYWGHLIALFAARSSDASLARQVVNEQLSGEQQRALFARTFGSLRLYVLLKHLRGTLSPERS